MNNFLGRDNAFLIQRDADLMRNEFVFDIPFNIVLLLGWTDQYDDDYYWVIYSKNRGIVRYSCCGGFVRLKGKLNGFDYYNIQHQWELNNPSLDSILNIVKEKGIILK